MPACRDSIELILSNGLTLGVLVAIFLHLVLPYHEDDDSLTVVIDGDAKPAKNVNVSASDEESVDDKVRVVLALFAGLRTHALNHSFCNRPTSYVGCSTFSAFMTLVSPAVARVADVAVL